MMGSCRDGGTVSSCKTWSCGTTQQTTQKRHQRRTFLESNHTGGSIKMRPCLELVVTSCAALGWLVPVIFCGARRNILNFPAIIDLHMRWGGGRNQDALLSGHVIHSDSTLSTFITRSF
uniref:Uncharacterized protein n=1 Tax=Attheya septentrionalis TaxID=420275 RepID=A0A7S2XLJ9_9STRA|mmetsp:Transcript_1880/g.3372  ORF Transcript_1880/g.3372 Transcript_1880/m.3372 type:complete len:119 (+) Transcript_1880:368-724(+)